MIRAADVPALQHMAVLHPELTPRQQEVATLVQSYYTVAGELPSAGWLSRRLSISRKNAREHVVALRRKNWLDRLR